MSLSVSAASSLGKRLMSTGLVGLNAQIKACTHRVDSWQQAGPAEHLHRLGLGMLSAKSRIRPGSPPSQTNPVISATPDNANVMNVA